MSPDNRIPCQMPCHACGSPNRPDARFCADCGTSLVPKPSCCSGTGAFALLAFVIVGGMVFVGLKGVDRVKSRIGRARMSTTTIVLDLPKDKADAVYKLIRPKDIDVRVGSTDTGVWIRGTRVETAVMDRLGEIITRYRHLPSGIAEMRVDEDRPQWTTNKRYKLSRSKARALFELLRPDDVPVCVGRDRKYVTVEATEADQAVIRRVVDILRGRHPKPLPEPARLLGASHEHDHGR